MILDILACLLALVTVVGLHLEENIIRDRILIAIFIILLVASVIVCMRG